MESILTGYLVIGFLTFLFVLITKTSLSRIPFAIIAGILWPIFWLVGILTKGSVIS